MMDDFVENMSVQAEQKHLHMTCEMKPGVPALVRGDPGRLRQVLTNLAGNAIKFTDEGSISVSVSCVSGHEDEVVLRFSVRDTGIGIPADKVNLLFSKFTQVDASTTRSMVEPALASPFQRNWLRSWGEKSVWRVKRGWIGILVHSTVGEAGIPEIGAGYPACRA